MQPRKHEGTEKTLSRGRFTTNLDRLQDLVRHSENQQNEHEHSAEHGHGQRDVASRSSAFSVAFLTRSTARSMPPVTAQRRRQTSAPTAVDSCRLRSATWQDASAWSVIVFSSVSMVPAQRREATRQPRLHRPDGNFDTQPLRAASCLPGNAGPVRRGSRASHARRAAAPQSQPALAPVREPPTPRERHRPGDARASAVPSSDNERQCGSRSGTSTVETDRARTATRSCGRS